MKEFIFDALVALVLGTGMAYVLIAWAASDAPVLVAQDDEQQ